MAWFSLLDCGSGSQTGANIIEQINNITAHFENEIIMTNDISNFDVTGLGIIGTPFEGFALCNGNNGTPDLRSRFIVGLDTTETDYDTIGKTGGEKEITLTFEQSGNRDHRHGTYRPEIYDSSGGSGAINNVKEVADNPSANTTGGEWLNTGENATEAHENRPPFYVLAYYKKI